MKEKRQIFLLFILGLMLGLGALRCGKSSSSSTSSGPLPQVSASCGGTSCIQ